MKQQAFVRRIFALTQRVGLHQSQSHQLSFDMLSRLVIGHHEGRPIPLATVEQLLATHAGALRAYSLGLRRDRDGLIPRGVRLGKLAFAPLVQLANIAGSSDFAGFDIPPLPKSSEGLLKHFDYLLGCAGYKSEIAQFKTLFGFELAHYAEFLLKQRRDDPALFLMLLAHEFTLAKARIGNDLDRLTWVENGAKLAELCRLIDITRFLEGKLLNVDQVRAALRALSRPNGPRKNEQATVDQAMPWIEQAAHGVEAIRALFLGDRDGPIAPSMRLSDVTGAMRVSAVGRCAWFAEQEPLHTNGARTLSKRFVRGRRAPVYTYYGISLDMLLIVGLRDLAVTCGRKGGVLSIRDCAEDIAAGLRRSGRYPKGMASHREATTADLYAKLYQSEAGQAGSVGRFDYRHWFGSPADDALYSTLFTLFVRPPRLAQRPLVRGQIKGAIEVLKGLLAPLRPRSKLGSTSLVKGVMTQFACGLTPLSMDPIFAALVERAIIERGFTAGMRKDPARGGELAGAKRLVDLFRRNGFRTRYARFADAAGRRNDVPNGQELAPLNPPTTIPVPRRRAAT